jgi:hypothetical protein
MDQKLRALLASKGISADVLDKLEQGDAPAEPEAILRKIAPDSPVLAEIQEVRDLLAKIKADVAAIKKADAQYPRPILGAQTSGTNGHALDLPNFLKGLRP